MTFLQTKKKKKKKKKKRPQPPASSARLAGELTSEELSAVCQRLPRGKAPGDDGLPYEFYAAFLNKVL